MSRAHTSADSRHSDGKFSSVRDELAGLQESVQSAAHDAADHGKRVVRAAGTAAKDAATGFRDSTLKAVGRTASERPLTTIAVAAGAGAVLMGLMMMWHRRA